MKRLLSILLITVILVSLAGCAKLVKTEYETVEVKVVDSYHESAFIQTIPCGKSVTTITYPAVYRITVEYEDVEYTIGGSDIYHAYKDKIGETVSATLEISTYDDGTIKRSIATLGEE